MNIIIKAIGIDIPGIAHAKDNIYKIAMAEGETVGQAIKSLNLPEDSGISYMLNGNHAPEKTVLKDQDEVMIMRMIYGG
ncbi:MAG: MoaD/ThiS family protein [Oscillospiraceae bacterium]